MSKRNLEKVLELVPEGVVGVDRAQKIRYFNASAQSIFGYSLPEILGKPLDCLIPEGKRSEHEHLVRKFESSPSVSRFMHRQRPVSALRSDGSVFVATITLIKSPVGRTPVTYAVLHDISDQIQREKALAASEEKYRLILETSPEPILIADANSGRIVEVNDAAGRLFSCTKSELVGLHQEQLHPMEQRERFRQTFKEHVLGVRQTVHDAVVQRSDGDVVPVDIAASLVPIQGKPHVIGFFRDMSAHIAQREELNQALATANSAIASKRSFLANMSHELRTPLNGIIGFAEIIKMEMLGPHTHERYREYGEIIHDSGQHLLSIVTDILDLSALDAGKLTLVDELVPIRAMLSECLKLLGRAIGAKAISVIVDVNPDLQLLVDRRALKQMLLNLLSNAVKYNHDRGSIAIGIADGMDGEACLVMSDSGVGIPANLLDEVTKPFGVVGSIYTRKAGGTGIGLHITKELVERHDGRLEIESELGHGTTVRLLFPLARLVGGQGSAVQQAPEERTAS